MAGLWKAALEKYPLPDHLEIIPEHVIFKNSFSLVFNSKDISEHASTPATPATDIREPGSYLATLLQNRRITHQEHSQDVRHMEFSIKDPVFPGYHPGDVLTMRPRNLDKDVTEFLEYNGWTSIADDPFTIVENLSDHPLPKHIHHRQTLRSLLTNHLNVFTTPRTSFFQLLIHFTDNEDEKDKLRDFVSPAGQDDLYSYCHRMKRTLFEVLQDFKDVKVPLNYMLDLFPIIMPRSFSIASAPLVSVQEQHNQADLNGVKDEHDHQQVIHTANGDLTQGNVDGELEWKVELCVAIVHYKTKLWKWRTGICTKWLKSLTAAADQALPETGTAPQTDENIKEELAKEVKNPSQFWVRLQRGTLKLPKDPNVPLICIGPGKESAHFTQLMFYEHLKQTTNFGSFVCLCVGTGVAPMRSFLHHRIYAQGANDNLLFFGCRKRDMDYHYREEWDQLEREGRLQVFAACSRDQVIQAPFARVGRIDRSERDFPTLSCSISLTLSFLTFIGYWMHPHMIAQEDKVYVQHLIEQNGPLVWNYLHERRGTILLSGSSNKMPADVTRALQRVIALQGNMSIEQANDYLNKVEKEGRFQQECWA